MNGLNIHFRPFLNGHVDNTQQSKGKTVSPEFDEAMDAMIGKCQEILYSRSEREVPENGQFSNVGAKFRIPDTSNEALLTVTYDETNPKTQRLFKVGVHHKNSDQITSEILKNGTKQEILDYLKNPENADIIKKSVIGLSEYVDKHY
ncbi:hypothetical protein IKQ26_00800 [bacterium]|nr:hypothetical protein [bacterium]